MANIFICSICLVFTALTLKALVRHIALRHASKPNFKVKCGVNGCPEEYDKIDSFRKHLRRRHEDEYEQCSCCSNSDNAKGGEDEQQPGNTANQLFEEFLNVCLLLYLLFTFMSLSL